MYCPKTPGNVNITQKSTLPVTYTYIFMYLCLSVLFFEIYFLCVISMTYMLYLPVYISCINKVGAEKTIDDIQNIVEIVNAL